MRISDVEIKRINSLRAYRLLARPWLTAESYRILKKDPKRFFTYSQNTINKIAAIIIFGSNIAIPKISFKFSDFEIVAFAPQSNTRMIMSAIKKMCDERELKYFLGGVGNPNRLRINFDFRDQNKVRDILSFIGCSSSVEVFVKFLDCPPIKLSRIADYWVYFEIKKFDIWVMEVVTDFSSPKIACCSIIEVDLWSQPIGYHEESLFSPSRTNTEYSRIVPSTFNKLLQKKEDIGTSMYEANFDVDIVYTWVDDGDSYWLSQKEKFLKRQISNVSGSGRAAKKERFRNRDELKYSLRSIEMFAPFVRNVYIVTADQMPSWLNMNHPKIKIVSHKDIYRDEIFLPTFNSSGIETQLHHIDGLAENFLYFNDDFFLGSCVQPLISFTVMELSNFSRLNRELTRMTSMNLEKNI